MSDSDEEFKYQDLRNSIKINIEAAEKPASEEEFEESICTITDSSHRSCSGHKTPCDDSQPG